MTHVNYRWWEFWKPRVYTDGLMRWDTPPKFLTNQEIVMDIYDLIKHDHDALKMWMLLKDTDISVSRCVRNTYYMNHPLNPYSNRCLPPVGRHAISLPEDSPYLRPYAVIRDMRTLCANKLVFDGVIEKEDAPQPVQEHWKKWADGEIPVEDWY